MVKSSEVKAPRSKDFNIIIEPLITEKSAGLGTAAAGGAAFVVDRRATKTEIKEAIERLFKVEVAAVRTMNYLGKPKKSGRSSGRRAAWKKACVQLKPGFSIELIEGV